MSSAVGSSTAPSKVPRKSSAATTSAAILGEASALVQRQRAKGESGLVKNESGGGEGILYMQKSDREYSQELARRSVAQVALQLGVRECTAETLDVLSDALIDFLEKLGRFVAHSVELSNRPSSHCNVYDVLHGVEHLLGQPAAQHMKFVSTGDAPDGVLATTTTAADTLVAAPFMDNGHSHHVSSLTSSKPPQEEQEVEHDHDALANDATRLAQHLSVYNGWESIAEFAFGPNWIQKGMELVAEQTKDPAYAPYLAKTTKITPNPETITINGFSNTNNNNNIINNNINNIKSPHEQDATTKRSRLLRDGWNAAYPDIVENYPTRKKVRLGFSALALLDEACLDEPRQILKSDPAKPDENKKEALAVDTQDTTKNNKPTENPSLSNPDSSDQQPETSTTPHHPTGPIPSWLPPFPPAYTYEPKERIRMKKLPSVSNSAPTDGNNFVRASLVNMHDNNTRDYFFHWGALQDIVVPLGVSDSQGSSSSFVVPLARPSVNRANRILEGSMDANPV